MLEVKTRCVGGANLSGAGEVADAADSRHALDHTNALTRPEKGDGGKAGERLRRRPLPAERLRERTEVHRMRKPNKAFRAISVVKKMAADGRR